MGDRRGRPERRLRPPRLSRVLDWGVRLRAPRIYPQLGDENWLRLRYVEQRISVRDIANELGCDRSTVIAALAAAGIPRPAQTRGGRRRFTQLGDHDWLRRRYLEDGASLQELAVEIGCSI